MNVQEVAQFAIGNEDLHSRDRWTLTALATLADEDGWLHIPFDDLCDAVGVTEPTFRKACKNLEAAGLLQDFGTKGPARVRRITLGEVS